jgi:hypothetical protein
MLNPLFFRAFLALSILVLATGCSTTSSMVKSVKGTFKGKGDGLTKRIVVLPIIDQAGVGEARLSRLSDRLMKRLSGNSNVLVQKADHLKPSVVNLKSPKVGISLDPDVIKIAEEMNMNAVIMFVIPPFEINTKMKGIWPFRKPRRELEISLIVSAVDIMNGTLFFNNLVSEKKVLPQAEPDMPETKEKIPEDRLDDILDEMLEDQISDLLYGLRDQPWSGRILSGAGKNLIINAGQDVGLQEGKVFEVFARGEPINSVSGKSLFLLGPKIGEIKAVEVMDSYASAAPLAEGEFKAGQVIRVKD